MSLTIEVCDPNRMEPVLKQLDREIDSGRHIVLLKGNLGSGKTHLVKAYVKQALGEDADSPTFALVNSYGPNGDKVHHFDLYRLKDAEEVEDIGLWDYLDQQVPCFIEWPDKITELLPQEHCIHIQIDVLSNLCRSYSFSH